MNAVGASEGRKERLRILGALCNAVGILFPERLQVLFPCVRRCVTRYWAFPHKVGANLSRLFPHHPLVCCAVPSLPVAQSPPI